MQQSNGKHWSPLACMLTTVCRFWIAQSTRPPSGAQTEPSWTSVIRTWSINLHVKCARRKNRWIDRTCHSHQTLYCCMSTVFTHQFVITLHDYFMLMSIKNYNNKTLFDYINRMFIFICFYIFLFHDVVGNTPTFCLDAWFFTLKLLKSWSQLTP